MDWKIFAMEWHIHILGGNQMNSSADEAFLLLELATGKKIDDDHPWFPLSVFRKVIEEFPNLLLPLAERIPKHAIFILGSTAKDQGKLYDLLRNVEDKGWSNEIHDYGKTQAELAVQLLGGIDKIPEDYPGLIIAYSMECGSCLDRIFFRFPHLEREIKERRSSLMRNREIRGTLSHEVHIETYEPTGSLIDSPDFTPSHYWDQDANDWPDSRDSSWPVHRGYWDQDANW